MSEREEPGSAAHEPAAHEPAAHEPAAARPEAYGQEAYAAAGELLRALAAPVRIAIVTELSQGQRCVHELVDALGVAQPLVSQHLRVLRGAGLVRGARRGREIAYSLVDEHVAHIVGDAVSHAAEHPAAGLAAARPASAAAGATSRTIDASAREVNAT